MSAADDWTCPECSTTGAPVGVVVRAAYDGALMWQCPACGWTVPRFTGADRLGRLSREYAQRANSRDVT